MARDDDRGHATNSNPDSPEYARLQATRADLLHRARESRDRRELLERERLQIQAKLAALEGDAMARQTRLRFLIDDAEATMQDPTAEYHEQQTARGAARAARMELADVEASLARAKPSVHAELLGLDAQIADLQRSESMLEEELSLTNATLHRLETERQAERTRNLQHQLAELEPVVREAASSGVGNLSKDYLAQAERHERAWKVWGAVLVITVVIAVGGSLLLFAAERIPTGPVDNETVVTIARNLLVVGLLLYLVRLASLQFRVHRHLDAVSRNKAAALSTFNRIVGVAGEPEVRTAIATVLAHAVFGSDDTGFMDGSDSHITLVERVAAGLPHASLP